MTLFAVNYSHEVEQLQQAGKVRFDMYKLPEARFSG